MTAQTQTLQLHEITAQRTHSDWSSLYRVGGVAALLVALFIPLQMTVFILQPPPTTVTGWFALYQQMPLVGLLDMDLLLIVDQVLLALVMVCLYMLLRRTSPSWMLIALVLELIGTATYFASTSAFEMLSLSRQYAQADGAQRTMLLTAGAVAYANWQGTAFNVAYVLQGISLLITALVMLRSNVFGRVTAYTAVALGVLAILPPTAGTIGMALSLLSVLPLWIWSILIGLRLLRIARSDDGSQMGPAAR